MTRSAVETLDMAAATYGFGQRNVKAIAAAATGGDDDTGAVLAIQLCHWAQMTLVTVRPDMCELLIAAERSMPAAAVTAETFPWAQAFVRLETPLGTDDPWTSNSLGDGTRSMPEDVGDVAKITGVRYDGDTDGVPAANAVSWADDGAGYAGMAYTKFIGDVGTVIAPTAFVFGRHGNVKERPPTERPSTLRLLQCLGLMLGQRIAVPVESTVHRQAARRYTQHTGHKDVPKVIEVDLRPPDRHVEFSEHRDVNWSHRWIVGGHWRNQYMPASDTHKPVWIAPHVKGPSSLPLVVKDRVHVWRR